MDAKRAVVHSGKYFLITTLFAVVGLAFVAAGAVLSRPALESNSVQAMVSAVVPGLVLAVIGLAVYRFGKAWALYKTLTAANEEALADTFDTQHVKSDIVSVVDDRLSDMQTELQATTRELRKLREDEPYDFSGDSSTTSTTTSGGTGSGSGRTSSTTTSGTSSTDSDTGTTPTETGFEPAKPEGSSDSTDSGT